MSKLFKCHLCSYITDRTYNFNRHAKKHSGEQHQSLTCIEQVQQGDQNDADESITNQSDHQYKCDKCLKCFTTSWYQKKHVAKCEGFRNLLQCTKCHKCFANRHNKSRHMKSCNTIAAQTQDHVNEQETATTSVIKCTQCYKTFISQYNLEKHLPICKGISNALECKHCHKVFSCRQSKSFHQQRCTQNKICDTLQDSTAIKCYGRENIDYITADLKDRLVSDFEGLGIVSIIKAIHFNPNHPENHNILKHDSKYCRVYDDGEWMLYSLKSTLENLVIKYKYVLLDHLMGDSFRENVPEDIWLRLYNYLAGVDRQKDPGGYYRIVRDVNAMFENMHHTNS